MATLRIAVWRHSVFGIRHAGPSGRTVRILRVVDVYTRECLALEADTSLGSGRVTRVLERLIEERPDAERPC